MCASRARRAAIFREVAPGNSVSRSYQSGRSEKHDAIGRIRYSSIASPPKILLD
jgi:hypothetical protein